MSEWSRSVQAVETSFSQNQFDHSLNLYRSAAESGKQTTELLDVMKFLSQWDEVRAISPLSKASQSNPQRTADFGRHSDLTSEVAPWASPAESWRKSSSDVILETPTWSPGAPSSRNHRSGLFDYSSAPRAELEDWGWSELRHLKIRQRELEEAMMRRALDLQIERRSQSSPKQVFSSREPLASSREPISGRLRHPGGAEDSAEIFFMDEHLNSSKDAICENCDRNGLSVERHPKFDNCEALPGTADSRPAGIREALNERSFCTPQTDRTSRSMSPNGNRQWSRARSRAVAHLEARLQARTNRRQNDSGMHSGDSSEISASKGTGYYGSMAQVFEQLSELEGANSVGAVSPQAAKWLSSSTPRSALMDRSRHRSTSPVSPLASRRLLPPPSLAAHVMIPVSAPAMQPQLSSQMSMSPGIAAAPTQAFTGVVPGLVIGAPSGMTVSPVKLIFATSTPSPIPSNAQGPFPFTAP